MEFIQRVVNNINSSDNWFYIQYCIPLDTDIWFIGKNIAKKLNAIEENFCNDHILLKLNDIYYKITWMDFPDDRCRDVVIEKLSPSELCNQ